PVPVPQDRADVGWRAVRCRRSRRAHRRGDRPRVPDALRGQPGRISRPPRMEGFRRHRVERVALSSPETWVRVRRGPRAARVPLDSLSSRRIKCLPPAKSRPGARLRTRASALLYLFRPCFSWLETQSEAEIAAPSEISPANATPPTISASRLTLWRPQPCRISRHSRRVARPVPPP